MPEMADGLNFVALSMGVFGLGEILRNLEHEHTRSVMVKHVSGLMLSKADFKRISVPSCAVPAWDRSSASCPAAAPCWRRSQPTHGKAAVAQPCRVRKGAIEGVAAPELANNAGAHTSFIPMLTLGIPSTPSWP